MAQAADEVETGRRDSQQLTFLGVSARERVRHDVSRTRPVLNREVKAQQLPDPVVLGNCGEALVEEVFEAIVVCLDDEAPPPEVRPPVPDRLD